MNINRGRFSIYRAATVAAFVVLGLAACSSAAAPSAESDSHVRTDLSLVQSKSPVQLLRNDVASQVPAIVIEGEPSLNDSSIACGGKSDAAGAARSWLSTATFLVTNSRAASIDNVISKITEGFVERKWATTVEGNATILSNQLSPATISIEAIHKSDADQPSIRISTSGPCVMTDGADSDEVKELEGKA